MEKKQ